MPDVTHSSDHTAAVENTDPLPIPPRSTTPDAPVDPICTAITQPTFYRVRDEDFPHPDEPTPDELNDLDQENMPPTTVPPTARTGSPIQAQVLGRTQMSILFSSDNSVNRALVSALTRVRNNVDHGNMYQLEIEEIVRIGRALQFRGTPNDDEEAALLVAQLDNIRRLELGTETDSTSSPPPTNISFPTPAIPCNSRVMAITVASRARVRTVARGSAPPQQTRTRGSRGSGSQARHLGARVPPIPEGVRVGAELLFACPSRRTEMPPPLGFNFNRGANYVPCIVTDSRGRGVPAHYTRVIMGPDPHVISIIPGDTSQYGGHCMQSLTMIRESPHGTPKMTSGTSSSALTTSIGSNRHSNISVTYLSPLRLHATVKPLASSSNTRKKYVNLKIACGKPASSRMPVDAGWKGLMLYIGLKRRWWIWIVDRGYITVTLGVRNVGVPSEKGVMLWNDV